MRLVDTAVEYTLWSSLSCVVVFNMLKPDTETFLTDNELEMISN